ncbi:hypothetical protein PsorP6_002407 [Peronosclerospora sorghi]|uniref:Uncharacterized protein n=1 Tax=Peronosclerospora sorghi TaxID=230839 RepID=A0ACC0WWK1_9STRA|nr:hypothetical protein PsorP6_002407 [Peronosclerospora sorghi]
MEIEFQRRQQEQHRQEQELQSERSKAPSLPQVVHPESSHLQMLTQQHQHLKQQHFPLHQQQHSRQLQHPLYGMLQGWTKAEVKFVDAPLMSRLRLRQIMVLSRYLAKSKHFYQEGLGLKLLRSSDTFAEFDTQTGVPLCVTLAQRLLSC